MSKTEDPEKASRGAGKVARAKSVASRRRTAEAGPKAPPGGKPAKRAGKRARKGSPQALLEFFGVFTPEQAERYREALKWCRGEE